MKQDNSDPLVSATIFSFLLSSFQILVALFVGFQFPDLITLAYLLASALLYAVGVLYGFKAMKCIEASEMSIIATSGSLFTILLSFIILHESLSPAQLSGALLLIIAVIIVQYERKRTASSGVQYAIISASAYGSAVIIDSFILRSLDMFSFMPISSFIVGSILLTLQIRRFANLKHHVMLVNKNLIMYTFLYVCAAITFYIPVQSGIAVAQVSSITKASTITTVVLAMIFLKERNNMGRKIIGAVLTTVGIFLLR